jgi:hypothetical protein
MRVFEDFRIEWNGKEVVVPSHRMMGLVHTVETIIPPLKLSAMMGELASDPSSIRPALISQVLSAILRYAGQNVSEEDVYNGLFGDAEKVYAVAVTIAAVIEGITPVSVREKFAKDGESGKPNRQARRAAASLSNKRSKSPAARQKKAASA